MRPISNRGQSLLAALIGTSVLAVIALEMGSAFQLMNATANNLKGKMGSVSLTSSIVQIVSKPASCMNHLMPAYQYYNSAAAQSTSGMPLGFLADDSVSQIYGPTAGGTPVPLPNYAVSVNSLSFTTSQSGPQGTDPQTGAGLYLGTLTANVLKLTDATQTVSGGRGLQPINFGFFYLAVNNSNKIVNCYAQPLTAQMACQALNGTYVADAIAPNPPCQLPYPCPQGQVFVGYNSSQKAICSTAAALNVLSCPAGHTVVANNSGGFVCE